jgi:hypothetical protein
MITFQEALEQTRRNIGEDDQRLELHRVEAIGWAIDVMGANYDAEAGFPDGVRPAILMRLSGTYDEDKERLAIADRLIDRWRDHVVA